MLTIGDAISEDAALIRGRRAGQPAKQGHSHLQEHIRQLGYILDIDELRSINLLYTFGNC
jgi:hypothetical protein